MQVISKFKSVVLLAAMSSTFLIFYATEQVLAHSLQEQPEPASSFSVLEGSMIVMRVE